MPSIAVGTGAGPSATGSIGAYSDDTAGYFTVHVGHDNCMINAPPNQVFCTITYDRPYLVAPIVVLTPLNYSAMNLVGANNVRVELADSSSLQFTVKIGYQQGIYNNAAPQTQDYVYAYHIVMPSQP